MIFNVLSGIISFCFQKSKKKNKYPNCLLFSQLFFLMFFANKNKALIPIILDVHKIEKMFGHTYSEVTGNCFFCSAHMPQTLHWAEHFPYATEE